MRLLRSLGFASLVGIACVSFGNWAWSIFTASAQSEATSSHTAPSQPAPATAFPTEPAGFSVGFGVEVERQMGIEQVPYFLPVCGAVMVGAGIWWYRRSGKRLA